MDRLSIAAVIPLYNGAKWIEKTLGSVFVQTLQPDEIIVVDDGSTDGGLGTAIVGALAKVHPNLTLLTKGNGGQSSARNLGIRRTKSDLIALLDQDDIWYPTHLHRLIEPFYKQHGQPLGWTYSNVDLTDEHGRVVVRRYLDDIPAEQPKRHLIRCLGEDMHVLPSASLISRRAFQDVGEFDEFLCGYEDDDLFLRLFVGGHGNVYLPEALSQWRMVAGSAGHSMRMDSSCVFYMEKLLRAFPDDGCLNCNYTRDAIAPRFLASQWTAFSKAVQAGNDERRRGAIHGIRQAAALLNGASRMKWQAAIPLMESRAGAHVVLAARPVLSRLGRWVMQ